MYGGPIVVGGDFRTAQQRQFRPCRGPLRIRPAGGGVVIGDGDTLQSSGFRLFEQGARRFRTVGEHGMAVNIPADDRRCGNTNVSHITIVS